MIRSNKFFAIVIIAGIVVIAGLGIVLWADKAEEGTNPFSVEKPENGDLNAPAPEATGNVDDLVDSLERELYEETAVIYEEDQDVVSASGDSAEVEGMINAAGDLD